MISLTVANSELGIYTYHLLAKLARRAYHYGIEVERKMYHFFLGSGGELAKKGRQRVLDNFTQEKAARETYKIYQKMVC